MSRDKLEIIKARTSMPNQRSSAWQWIIEHATLVGTFVAFLGLLMTIAVLLLERERYLEEQYFREEQQYREETKEEREILWSQESPRVPRSGAFRNLYSHFGWNDFKAANLKGINIEGTFDYVFFDHAQLAGATLNIMATNTSLKAIDWTGVKVGRYAIFACPLNFPINTGSMLRQERFVPLIDWFQSKHLPRMFVYNHRVHSFVGVDPQMTALSLDGDFSVKPVRFVKKSGKFELMDVTIIPGPKLVVAATSQVESLLALLELDLALRLWTGATSRCWKHHKSRFVTLVLTDSDVVK